MVQPAGSNANNAPTTLAALSLPPTFVADHCLRTFFYQGALSAAELARRWLVPPDIGFQIIDQLKAEGLLHADAAQTTFERHGRLDLTPLGRERAVRARERTWYSGPLPVALAEFSRRMDRHGLPGITRSALREALRTHHLEAAVADQIGEGMSGGETVVVAGLTPEEQPVVAHAVGSAMRGETVLPHALYAAGAVVRLFDARYHRRSTTDAAEDDDLSILRSAAEDQWTPIAKPVVVLKGGIAPSEVLPSYDADARFYIAPAPLVAAGGMLAIAHADLITPDAMAVLSRLWLVPGRSGSGMLVLRTGERIEVPWRASVLLFGASSLADTLEAGTRLVDASTLPAAALYAYLEQELDGVLPETLVHLAAERLDKEGLALRVVAAAAARHLRARAAYEGDDFQTTEATIGEAIDIVTRSQEGGQKLRLVS